MSDTLSSSVFSSGTDPRPNARQGVLVVLLLAGLLLLPGIARAGIAFQSPTALPMDLTPLYAGAEAVSIRGLAAADFDGDGHLDLAATADAASPFFERSAILLFRGFGDGTFAPPEVVAGGMTEGDAQAIVAGDFNGDGHADLVAGFYLENSVWFFAGRGDGRFEQPVVTSLNRHPAALQAQDLDGDGRLDLVVMSRPNGWVGVADQSLSILRGEGDGRFSILADIDLTDVPLDFGIADIDGTNGPDIVAVTARGDGQGTLIWLLNDGAAGFGDTPSSLASPIGPAVVGSGSPTDLTGMGLYLADFDGDGRVDAAVAGGQAGSEGALARFGNSGAGGFLAPAADAILTLERYPTRGNGANEVADFDGDGRPDLLFLHLEVNFATVGLNDGSGGFRIATYVPAPAHASSRTTVDKVRGTASVAADFDGDGRLDLAAATMPGKNGARGGIAVLRGEPEGRFRAPRAYATSQWVDSPAILLADADGDDALDLLALVDPVDFLPGTGDGRLGRAVPATANPASNLHQTALRGADFNGDGVLDLAWVDGFLQLALGQGGGRFDDPLSFAFPAPYRGLEARVADFDGDGAPDVAVLQTHDSIYGARQLQVWLNRLADPTPAFVAATTLPLSGATDWGERGLEAADFDGDGKHDLVVRVGPDNRLLFLKGRGDGTFDPATTAADGPGPDASHWITELRAADLDGDGALDLVATGSTLLWSLMGNGDGTFHTPRSFDTGIMPVHLRLADFDGDGRLDAAVVNTDGFVRWQPAVSVLPGLGDGAFGSARVLPIGVHTAAELDAGDLNGDGLADLVVSHPVANRAFANALTVHLAESGPVADLGITATARTLDATVGRPLNLTFTVTNAGPDAAANSLVRIPLPPGASALSGTTSQGEGCTMSQRLLLCRLGELAAEASATVEITYTPGELGSHWLTASARSDATDPRQEHNGTAVQLDARAGVSLSALEARASEAGPTPARFRIELEGPADTPLSISLSFLGDALAGNDYTLLGPIFNNTVTIPAGATGATLTVIPVADNVTEADETVTLSLLPDPTGSQYRLSGTTSATITISDGAAGGANLDATGLYPPAGGNAGPITLTVSGQGFSTGTTVLLRAEGQPDIPAEVKTVNDAGTQLTLTANLAGAPVGDYDIIITNPDGTTRILPAAFTVEPGRGAEIWVDIIGREAVRAAVRSTFFLMVGNKGDGDSQAIYLNTFVPAPLVVATETLPSGSQIEVGDDGTLVSYLIAPLPPGTTLTLPLNIDVPHGIGDTFQIETLLAETPALTSIALSTNNDLQVTPEILEITDNGISSAIHVRNEDTTESLYIDMTIEDVDEMEDPAYKARVDENGIVIVEFTTTFKTVEESNKLSTKSPYATTKGGILEKIKKLTTIFKSSNKASKFISDGIYTLSPEMKAEDAIYVIKMALIDCLKENGWINDADITRLRDIFTRLPKDAALTAKIASILKHISPDKKSEILLALIEEISSSSSKTLKSLWYSSTIEAIATYEGSNLPPHSLRELSSKLLYTRGESSRLGIGAHVFSIEQKDKQAVIREILRSCINQCKFQISTKTHSSSPYKLHKSGEDSENEQCGKNDSGYSTHTQFNFSTVTSFDPNDKVAAQGVGEDRYVDGESPLRYVIYFENDPEKASAPAQVVRLVDPLDGSVMDLESFELGPIFIGDYRIVPPAGAKRFAATVDIDPGAIWMVGIEAGLDVETSTATWTFRTIDRATGLPLDPADPRGFLPPNTEPPAGEGNVSFTIRPKADLPTGTLVCNGAQIFFDANEPIETPARCNALDFDLPQSAVAALAARQTGSLFTVSWSGSDAGSGIRDYTVYVARDDGPFQPWLIDTTETGADYRASAPGRYAFFTIARDGTGHVEPVPTTVDAETEVTNHPPAALKLLGPDHGHEGAGTTVRFSWNRTSDPDGDPVTYRLCLRAVDPLFDEATDCQQITVAQLHSLQEERVAMSDAGNRNREAPRTLLAAAIPLGAPLFALGLFGVAAQRGRNGSRLVVVLLLALMAGGCSGGGGGGDDTAPAPEPPQNSVTKTITGLQPGTTYYWKVIAEDDKGGRVESEVRSFTTR